MSAPETPARRSRSPIGAVRELIDVTGPAGLVPVMFLMFVSAVERFDAAAFGILGPDIRDAFHLSNKAFVPIATLTGLVPLLLSVPLGYWSDRTNRVRLSWVGAIVWGITSIALGLSPTVWFLAIARIAGGSGQLVNEVTHPSLLSDYYPPDAMAPVFSFYGIAAGGIGLIAGPLSGALGQAVGWRTTFIALALPTFFFAFLVTRLKEPARGQSLGLVPADEERTTMSESFRRLRAVRSLRRIWLAAFFFGGGTASFGTYLSLFFKDVYHLGPAPRGYISALFGVGGLVGLAVGGRLSQNAVKSDRPQRLPVINGLMIVEFAIGIFLMAIAPNEWLSIAAVVILSLGAAGFVPAYRTLVAFVVDARLRSQAFAWSLIFFLLGAGFVSGIIGGIGDQNGQRVALAVLAVLVAIGGFVAVSAEQFVRRDISEARTVKLASEGTALLTCRGLDVAYAGGVQVLFNVDFDVEEGQVIALLGTNGAGKSTLLRAISGLLDPIGGAIFFNGRDITHSDPVVKTSMGIVQVPGGRGVFPGLTVAENLRIAGWLFRRDAAYIKEATDRVCEYFPILRDYWDLPAANLSGGQQQMLTLAQALLARPRLLMIDELSLGLAPVIVEALLQTVRRLAQDGTTIILVEQSVNIALTVADTAYFMEKGEIRFHGPTSELLERPDVLRSVFLEGAGSMTGETKKPAARPRRAELATRNGSASPSETALLQVSALTKRFGGVTANDDVTFDLADNQILGLIGPNGAGKTTLFDMLSGFTPPDSGHVVLRGADITDLAPDVRARLGLGRSFQDARLFPALTVAETIALSLEKSVAVRDPLAAALNLPAVAESEREIDERVDELVDLMGLGAFRDKFVSDLSTGSRRIVDLACILAMEPSVIMFDEPSSGIAQRETEALGPLLLRIRDATNASLLVIEHDMPLITSISDEILALDLGRVITRGTAEEVVNDPRVIASYLGSSDDAVHRSGVRGLSKPDSPTVRRRRRTTSETTQGKR